MAEVPVLRIIAEADRESLGPDDTLTLTFRLIYDVPLGSRPIVVHNAGIGWVNAVSHMRQAKERNNPQAWSIYEDEDETFGGPYDSDEVPDIEVNVAGHGNFLFMNPGDTWTDTIKIQLPHYGGWIPADAAPGDEFRFMYEGVDVDWWDWGTKDDHLATKVTLPYFIHGKVQKPVDNDGRPKLRIPPSNAVQFKIVEGK